MINKKQVDIDKAGRYLGRGWSRSSILRRIDSGELIEGVHWIDDSPMTSPRRRIKLNILAIEQYLSKPAALR